MRLTSNGRIPNFARHLRLELAKMGYHFWLVWSVMVIWIANSDQTQKTTRMNQIVLDFVRLGKDFNKKFNRLVGKFLGWLILGFPCLRSQAILQLILGLHTCYIIDMNHIFRRTIEHWGVGKRKLRRYSLNLNLRAGFLPMLVKGPFNSLFELF